MQLSQAVVLFGLLATCLAFNPNRTVFEVSQAGLAKRSVDAGNEAGKEGLSNVILLMIDGLGQKDTEKALTNAEFFPVQTSLKVCSPNTPSCDCEGSLKKNIAALLSWAQDVKGMSTSALIENFNTYAGEEPAKATAYSREPHASDVISRMRKTMFHSLLKSLGSRSAEPARRSYDHMSPFYELTMRTLEDLGSFQNTKGFILVGSTGAAELDEALGLVHHFVPSKDCLVVVTGSCPQDSREMVPMFARGPGSERIISSIPQYFAELPNELRNIINEFSPRSRSAGRLEDSAFQPLHIESGVWNSRLVERSADAATTAAAAAADAAGASTTTAKPENTTAKSGAPGTSGPNSSLAIVFASMMIFLTTHI